MNRRNFVKALATSGIILNVPGLALQKAHAAEVSNHNWVFVVASGGWDITHLWDPKGKEIDTFRGPMNKYKASDIRKKGNIRYAPVAPNVSSNDYLHTFTQKHYNRMMVINGIDMETNGHKTGKRVALSGDDGALNPVAAAIIAAPYASEQPMAMLTNGGLHESTGDLVSASTILRSKGLYTDLLASDAHVEQSIVSRLNANRLAKIELLKSSTNSARTLSVIKQLESSRSSGSGFENFIDQLPAQSKSGGSNFDVEVIASAIGAGICTSAQMSMGGFDTHTDSDAKQNKSVDSLLETVDYLWDELSRHGVEDKTTIVLVSDFGRTPGYNNRDGKDHWPTNSFVLMGKSVRGNQVVGATDDNLAPKKVNPNTLELDNNGITITPGVIHRAIRDQIGIYSGSPIDRKFPMEHTSIPLFT